MIPAGFFVLLGLPLILLYSFIIIGFAVRQPFDEPYLLSSKMILDTGKVVGGSFMFVFGRIWWRRTTWLAVIGCMIGYSITAYCSTLEKRYKEWLRNEMSEEIVRIESSTSGSPIRRIRRG